MLLQYQGCLTYVDKAGLI